MRILILADIHGNWPALQALNEPCDVCLCLGDLVDYALEPAPCIDWVRRNAHHVVRGNHDHGAAQNVTIQGRNGFRYLTAVTRPLTRERLGEEDLRYLSRLPLTQMVTLDDTRFLLVHATPRDPMDEYAPPDVAFWERRLQNVEADVICVGHTHQPYGTRWPPCCAPAACRPGWGRTTGRGERCAARTPRLTGTARSGPRFLPPAQDRAQGRVA